MVGNKLLKKDNISVVEQSKTHNTHRLLGVEKDALRFQFYNCGNLTKELLLKAGYQFITDSFFKGDLPTEAQTEYAINYIEDALMSNKELINDNSLLVSAAPILRNAFHENELKEGLYTRAEIEDIFSNSAYTIRNSRLAPDAGPFNKESFAAILLLREIVHHLNFEYFKLN